MTGVPSGSTLLSSLSEETLAGAATPHRTPLSHTCPYASIGTSTLSLE